MIVRDWIGETAFVIAGGPSVATQPIERLRGRKVIIINSSYERAPWADVLFFHDDRWWREHKDALLGAFSGQIFTTSRGINHPRVERLTNCKPAPLVRSQQVMPPPMTLSDAPCAVPMRHTSTVPALNIALLKGANRIVLLGADGKFGPNGERNHHRPHRWEHRAGTWDWHRQDLEPLVLQFAAREIEVVNASPGSALGDLWRIMTLEEALERCDF